MEYLDILTDVVASFYYAENINVSILNKKGEIIKSFGQDIKYCQLFHDATGKFCPCFQIHHQSCLQAVSLGESYIFACPAGLIHFSVAVMKAHKHVASILAGPISLEYPDMSIIDTVMQQHNLPMEYRSKLYGALSAVPLVEPVRARYLSKLLFLLINNPLAEEQRDERTGKNTQQARIGEYMQIIKSNPAASPSQFQQEKLLIADVLQGDAASAKARLNEMLGNIYFTSGNSIEIIKTRTIELITVLSRALIEGGENPDTVYRMSEEYLAKISGIPNLTDLSYVLMETLEKFTSLAFPNVTESNLALIKKSIRYMNQTYASGLTLEEVASFIGMNPTYFSNLFKRETGMNFSYYINKLRVDQAKRLLKSSGQSLLAVAEEVGFESQSYFTKVFKKMTGTTPKQFRESL